MQRTRGKRAAARVTVAAFAALFALLTAAATAGADSTVVGQWRFDEGSGQTALDDGPFGLDGRLGSTDADDAWDPARVGGVAGGGALRFSNKSFVRLPTATELEPQTLTVEAVVRGDTSPGAYRYIVSRGASGCDVASYGLYTGKDGGIAFYTYNGVDYRVTAAAAPADVWNGQWHHVAGVFDGASVRLYVDGRPVGVPHPAPKPIAYGLASPSAYFGTYQGTCALPVSGDVDLVRIWNGPLSGAFVSNLSDAALDPSPPAPPTDGDGNGPVPTATTQDSNADGPPSPKAALTPVATGQSLTWPAPKIVPKAVPGAPVRACVIKPSKKSVRVGRKTSFTVSVALRGKPLKAAKVVARDTKSRKRLASGKTASNGKTKLKVKPKRRGRVTVSVSGRIDCTTATVTVKR
jgi:hypothetical protein